MGKVMNMGLIFGRILRKLASSNLRRLPGVVCIGAPKTIYLTFDDGPDPHVTPKLLDLLKYYDVKATFFINGHHFNNSLELFKRMLSEGHLLGNHTFSHCSLLEFNSKNFDREIIEFQSKIESLGVVSRLFRPTKGLLSPRCYIKLVKKKFKIVFWNIDSGDSLYNDKLKIVNFITKYKSGVILFHDDSSLCIDVLKEVIPFWINQGIKFDVIRERE